MNLHQIIHDATQTLPDHVDELTRLEQDNATIIVIVEEIIRAAAERGAAPGFLALWDAPVHTAAKRHARIQPHENTHVSLDRYCRPVWC